MIVFFSALNNIFLIIFNNVNMRTLMDVLLKGYRKMKEKTPRLSLDLSLPIKHTFIGYNIRIRMSQLNSKDVT